MVTGGESCKFLFLYDLVLLQIMNLLKFLWMVTYNLVWFYLCYIMRPLKSYNFFLQ
jgi:hypothetical protein